MDLRQWIRDIPNFPRPGIVFRDITPLLVDPDALRYTVDELAERVRVFDVDLVVAPEARGFILGGALAMRLGAGFVPARRPGKLPYDSIQVAYELEYGVDELEVHSDALAEGARVLVHDDLIATGGTASAVAEAIGQLGGQVVGFSFLVELSFLGGRDALAPTPVEALVRYDV
jgi:adenine phosphoribosyltransferase